MDDQNEQFDTTILRKAGLTESQAKGYLALIEHGQLSPAKLGELTGESRTNAYMICDKLEKLGLAIKKDTKDLIYAPAPPTALKALLIKQQQQLKQSNEELSGILPALMTKFRLNSDSPGVTSLEGVSGIKTLYGDLLRGGHDLSIIPSQYDRIDTEVSDEIDKQIAKQLNLGIKSRVLYPKITAKEAVALKDRGVEVRACNLEAPAQIIIYGQSVAISTFRHGMITSVINHPDIAETLQALFDQLWERADTATHQE